MPRRRPPPKKPRDAARSSTAPTAAPAFVPVRLVTAELATPFLAGRGTVFARVAGDALAALEIRDGDHVVLERRDHVEHGDVAAVLDARGSG